MAAYISSTPLWESDFSTTYNITSHGHGFRCGTAYGLFKFDIVERGCGYQYHGHFYGTEFPVRGFTIMGKKT